MAEELSSSEAGSEAGSSEEEEEEEEESSEEEPALKYLKLAANIDEILTHDCARVLKAQDKFLVLGTKKGYVYLLDFSGYVIKRFQNHTKQVNDISISGDYIASCSDDGKIVILHVFDKGNTIERHFELGVCAVSLVPEYDTKTNYFLFSGGYCDQFMLSHKKFFGRVDSVIHAGEGCVQAVEWCGDLIAWANDRGVKIYDHRTRERLTFIARENPSTLATEGHRCCLYWQDEAHLIIGWDNTVKVVEIRSCAGHLKSGARFKQVKVLRKFRFDNLIVGVATWNDNLVILVYTETEDSDSDSENASGIRNKRPSLPELRIISSQNKEAENEDVLPIAGYENYKPEDYRFEVLRNSHETYFFVVSPKTILVAKPRNQRDHVNWLTEKGKYIEAIEFIEQNAKKLDDFRELLRTVGDQYLTHLIESNSFLYENDSEELQNLNTLCPKIFGDDQAAWEKWIISFDSLHHLTYIIDCIPVTGRGKLRPMVYEKVLHKLLFKDKKLFLKKVFEWPIEIYNVGTIITSVNHALREHNDKETSTLLKRALAELYLKNRQYDKTLEMYLELQDGPIFDHINKFQLYDAVKQKILPLMKFDKENEYKNAINLCVEKRKEIPMQMVVQQLQTHEEILFNYLDSVFQADPNDTMEFSHHLFKLYAIYKPSTLKKFLMSNDPPLREAWDICEKRIKEEQEEERKMHLYEAKVHILERMGNSKLALQVIVQKLKNVKKAIEFVERSKDEGLWDDLIKQSLDSSGQSVADLLDCIGGSASIKPVQLIQQIERTMQIPDLSEKIRNLLEAYSTEVVIRNCANKILETDCFNAYRQKVRAFKQGVLVNVERMDSSRGARIYLSGQVEHL